MNSYLVLRSFAGPEIGTHSEGEIMALEPDAARGLVSAGFIMPVKPEKQPEIKRDEVVVETADLPVEKVEKAVKRPRKKKE